MYYQLRNKAGSLEEATSGSIILEDGTVVPLTLDEVQVEVLDSWTSPKTGSSYPSGWRLRVPSQEIELTVTPITPNQELNVSVIYWEGAVMVEGTIAGEAITGRGYVELTGYDGQAVPMG
jgi:predicted secreted hydrolase